MGRLGIDLRHPGLLTGRPYGTVLGWEGSYSGESMDWSGERTSGSMDPPSAVVSGTGFDRSAHGSFDGRARDCLTKPARSERFAQKVECLKPGASQLGAGVAANPPHEIPAQVAVDCPGIPAS